MRKLVCALMAVLCVMMTALGASAQVIEMEGKAANKDIAMAIEIIRNAECVEKIVFDDGVLSPESLQALRDAFPDTEMEYSISVLGKRVRSTAEKINLSQTPVNGGKSFEKLMKALPWLPCLTEIRALQSSFTYDEMEQIHTVLPNVHVSAKLRVRKHYVRTDVTAFSTRHSTSSTRYTSEDFRVLKYMDNLLALDIGHNAVTDLDFLYDLPNLKVLILADNQVTDLTPVASLQNLEYLELFLNDDLADLSPLAKLPNLIDLHAGSCSVDDLTPLFTIPTLDRLWIGENPYDEQQVESLRKALSNCTINTTAWQIAYTAEGWRQGHPRYLTIVNMFQTGRYKEFAK